MQKTDVVCLCDLYNLIEFFGEHFEIDNPWVNLLLPQNIEDPDSIRHAIAFSPGPTVFQSYPNLQLVSCVGAGVDALLDNPSLKPEVEVTRVVIAEQAQMIASFAMWYIQGWQRKMWEYPFLQSKKNWHVINRTPPSAFPVGILGCGKIGGTLAQALIDLGYPVKAYGTSSRQEGKLTVLSGQQGLEEIAIESSAIVNILPLTDETNGVLSSEFFSKMREESILIHLGRGAHLIENDLIYALAQGRPSKAALDVFATEPLPPEHPFWENKNIMLTPHAAGDADFRAIAQFVADGISRFENGEKPVGLVNRQRGY